MRILATFSVVIAFLYALFTAEMGVAVLVGVALLTRTLE